MTEEVKTRLSAQKGQAERLEKSVRKNADKIAAQMQLPVPDDENARVAHMGQITDNIDSLVEIHKRYETVIGNLEVSVAGLKNVEGVNQENEDKLNAWTDHSLETVALLTRASNFVRKNFLPAESGPNGQNVPTPSSHVGASNLEGHFERLLSMLAQNQVQPVSERPANAGQGSDSRITNKTVKLPKLELPKFNGDVLGWRLFWDSFKSAVHDNASLQPVDKLNYLLAQLSGEARKAVDGLSVTNDNYQIAVDLLTGRFGKTKPIVTALYGKLMNLRPVSNDGTKIRAFLDEIECTFRSLQALGQETTDEYFVSIILSKLPQEVILILERSKSPEDDWTVDSLRKALSAEISTRELAKRRMTMLQSPSVGTDSDKGLRNPNHGSTSRAPNTGASLFVSSKHNSAISAEGSSGRVALPTPRCVYCEESHFSNLCKRFPTLNARRAKLEGRCYNCLGKGHRISECRSNKPCFHCKAKHRHHTSICPVKYGRRSAESTGGTHVAAAENAEAQAPEHGTIANAQATEGVLVASGGCVVLQTALTKVVNPNDSSIVSTARILLDSGSNRSYISEDLAARLKLVTRPNDCISVHRFATEKVVSIPTKVTEISMSLCDGLKTTVTVTVVPKITGSLCRMPVELTELNKIARRLQLADTLPKEAEFSPIDILLGNDYYLDFVTSERLQVCEGLYLLYSSFGWILSGRIPDSKQVNEDYGMFVQNLTTLEYPTIRELQNFGQPDGIHPKDPNLEDLWRLESLGISDSPVDLDDEIAETRFRETIQRDTTGRYQVALPWKPNSADLPDNFKLAYGRLNALVRRMSDSPELAAKYAAIIEDQLQKGVIEKVDGRTEGNANEHYIPHHEVLTPQKNTTKVRIVYDGSAKKKRSDVNINECLYRGPVLLENLCGLLVRFQLSAIAITADIEKAFLQVGVQSKDRDALRFLWLKNPTSMAVGNNLQIFRFCRVPFGLNCSPFLLAGTNRHHLEACDSEVAKQILSDLYVDNVITGVDSPCKATGVYTEAKTIFCSAKMNLREWSSNSQEFLSKVPQQDVQASKVQTVLGIKWDCVSDQIAFQVPSINEMQCSKTKREVLRCISKIFDPLGLLLPVTIRGKLFLQTLSRDRTKWDSNLSNELLEEWKSLATIFADVEGVVVPRYVGQPFVPGESKYHLVCFSDASERAYSSAVYLLVSANPSLRVRLIFAKSRVSPLRSLTVPRLELMGVLIGIRCLKFLKSVIRQPIEQMTLFSDSSSVLGWLSSNKDRGTFINNRISEIRQLANITYRYVPTDENPADLATRGKTVKELSNFWFHGPDWLTKPEENWPFWEIPDSPDPNLPLHQMSLVSQELNVPKPPFGMDIARFSSLIRLLRVTAWCIRFINQARSKKRPRQTLQDTDVTKKLTELPITTAELEQARFLWEKTTQESEFANVLKLIVDGKQNTIIKRLGLRRDDKGLLRCHMRLANADMDYNTKFPKLLPKNGHFTMLIIRDAHEKVLHFGVAHTLSRVRSTYWIPHGRTVVRGVLLKCAICRRYEGKPYSLPPMPELPKSRVCPQPAFSYTGVDYFGPLYVRDGAAGGKKTWVALFTCLTVRAIHLELVNDMTAASFLLAFRRFLARRGKPKQITSDNGPQFVEVDKVIKKAWSEVVHDEEVLNYCSQEEIEWTFITPFAPWQGGVYERMVGITKRALRKSLGKLKVTQDQMSTLLCEVESVVNTRPLLYLDDTAQVLTPAHFLMLNPNPGIPSFAYDKADPTYLPNHDNPSKLLKFWRKGQSHLNSFWHVWRNDYLVSLRDRLAWHHRNSPVRPFAPNIGHMVLIKDEIAPRGTWRLGRIRRLLISSDGKVRSADIVLPSRRIISRPVNILYPFELTEACSEDLPRPENTTEKNHSSLYRTHPTRKAATAARQKWQGVSDEPEDEDCSVELSTSGRDSPEL